MRLLKPLLVGILLFGTTYVFPHALFIEANPNGKVGTEQKVVVFYSEPLDKREVLADWWSDVPDFKLWLTQPDGSKELLNVIKNKDHFTTTFTPLSEGAYHLAIHHNVADLYGQTQYQFNTSATVAIGKEKTDGQLYNTGLSIHKKGHKNPKKGDTVSILLLDGQQPLGETSVTVFSPKGWSKTITTNTEGVATFSAEWGGDYVLEGSRSEEVSGQKFTKRERIVTAMVRIK